MVQRIASMCAKREVEMLSATITNSRLSRIALEVTILWKWLPRTWTSNRRAAEPSFSWVLCWKWGRASRYSLLLASSKPSEIWVCWILSVQMRNPSTQPKEEAFQLQVASRLSISTRTKNIIISRHPPKLQKVLIRPLNNNKKHKFW